MKLKYLLLILLILILGAGGAYWYFFMMSGTPTVDVEVQGGTTPSTGFVPYDRGTSGNGSVTPSPTPEGNVPSTDNSADTNVPTKVTEIPTLRLLSNTPVGGYGASTTASTTLVRWVDRGRGNIYEAREDSVNITTLSNTVVPRIYESSWNKNLTAFLGAMLPENSSNFDAVYAELRTQNATSTTPFVLKGKDLPENTLSFVFSPKKDRIFLLLDEEGSGAGYTAKADGSSLVRIFTTPLTQLNIDWPEENTITITTKASFNQDGYLYFINPKTGLWRKVLGPLKGLSAKVSHDAKYALISYIDGKNDPLRTNIYDLAKKTSEIAGVRTLAEKCVWGNFYKEVFYCGVSPQLPEGVYPDDWYSGVMSFKDKLWQINAGTGQIKQVSAITDQSDRLIDAYKLDLDRNDNYLFFMNKNDLSLWSLDLVRSR